MTLAAPCEIANRPHQCERFPQSPKEAKVTLLLALLIGVIAGLRAMTAPAAVSWAAYLGWIDLVKEEHVV